MNKLNVCSDLILCVSKRTKTSVITFFDILGIKLAELCLIAIRMVQLLELIMRKLAFLVVTFLFCT